MSPPVRNAVCDVEVERNADGRCRERLVRFAHVAHAHRRPGFEQRQCLDERRDIARAVQGRPRAAERPLFDGSGGGLGHGGSRLYDDVIDAALYFRVNGARGGFLVATQAQLESRPVSPNRRPVESQVRRVEV